MIKFRWLPKFPDRFRTLGLFPDLSRIPRHCQVSRNSRKVVTVHTVPCEYDSMRMQTYDQLTVGRQPPACSEWHAHSLAMGSERAYTSRTVASQHTKWRKANREVERQAVSRRQQLPTPAVRSREATTLDSYSTQTLRVCRVWKKYPPPTHQNFNNVSVKCTGMLKIFHHHRQTEMSNKHHTEISITPFKFVAAISWELTELQKLTQNAQKTQKCINAIRINSGKLQSIIKTKASFVCQDFHS